MSKTKWSFVAIAAAMCISVWLLTLPDHRPKVKTAIIRQGTFVKSSQYYGVVNYRQEPLISSSAGVVEQICAAEGDAVFAGQLLVRFDTQLQEQALAKMLKKRSLDFSKLPQTEKAALALVQNADILRAEQEIRMEIQEAQIRAKIPGMIDALYVQNGDYVQAGMLVGMVRSKEKQVCLTAEYPNQLSQAQSCVILSGKERTIASLCEVQSPQTASTGFSLCQQLWYRAETSRTLETNAVGERVMVEVLEEYRENQTLVPLTAVSLENEIWIVEDGKVYPVPVDIILHNEQYLVADSALTGKKVILDPDAANLERGGEVLEVSTQ